MKSPKRLQCKPNEEEYKGKCLVKCNDKQERNPNTNRCKKKSPKRKSQSPKRKSPSPKRKSQSPKRKSQSPKRKSPSPKRKSQSPKRKSPSPKRKSPSPKRKSHKKIECNKNQEINPISGRCRLRCTIYQERNHAGKCVKIKIQNKDKQSPTKSPPQTKSPSKIKSESKYFIDLCKNFIMVTNLDHVYKSTWLQNDDCNIFLVGEQHNKHDNVNCVEILEMFRQLVKTNNISENPIKIDFFIEIYNEYVLNSHKYKLRDYNYDEVQINNIRTEFLNCIKNKNCPNLHVHWADPTIIAKTHKRYKKLPKWLKIFQKDEVWKHTENNIDENIIIFILKLLTENPIVIKEFKKASKNNIMFKIEKIKSIYLEIYDITKKLYKDDYNHIIFCMSRTVMDFYTIARIIKSKNKNIIIYAGNDHTERIIYILNKYFVFEVKKQILGNCYVKLNFQYWESGTFYYK
jgi:hypothetical protein